MAGSALPDYEPLLESYHKAFAPELEAMVNTLSVAKGDLVLEMACGDGAYTPWLLAKVGDKGGVVGLDISPDYLALAKSRASRSGERSEIRFVAASIGHLPFVEESFDAVWCAQSLFSLPEPVEAVARMARMVRPGGLVAVLEDDTLHQVLLPWPIEVELAVRRAEWEALRDDSDHPRKYYVGRRLVGVFREAGLVDLRVDAFASTRVAPLDDVARIFASEYLRKLRERVSPRLGPEVSEAFDKLADPGSPDFLPDQPDLCLTVVDHLIQGRVPAPPP